MKAVTILLSGTILASCLAGCAATPTGVGDRSGGVGSSKSNPTPKAKTQTTSGMEAPKTNPSATPKPIPPDTPAPARVNQQVDQAAASPSPAPVVADPKNSRIPAEQQSLSDEERKSSGDKAGGIETELFDTMTRQIINKELQHALEFLKAGESATWADESVGVSGILYPGTSYFDTDLGECRPFRLNVETKGRRHELEGRACRQAGLWKQLGKLTYINSDS